MAETQKNRRQTLIIDKDLQDRLVKDVCLVPIIALIVGTVMVFVCFLVGMQAAEAAGVDLPGFYGLVIALIGLTFVTTCYVMVKTSVRFSNRVAGPIHRLHLGIEKALKGDMESRITLRKDDYLKDTAYKFNKLLDHLDGLRQNIANRNINIEKESEAVTHQNIRVDD